MKRLLALLLVLFAAPAVAQGPGASKAVVQTENVRAELLADVSAGILIFGSTVKVTMAR